MPFNPPPTNITNNVEIFTWLNTSVGNFFFPGVIIALYIIILVRLMFSTDDLGKSFSAASFICMLFTVLLRLIDLVNTQFMVIFIILTAVGVIWMHVENTR